jgi:uncharacterized protein (TIGR02147 family)
MEFDTSAALDLGIFSHISYRDCLKGWYESKKSLNSSFSYRLVSRLMGQKSPSFLRDIVNGDRNLNSQQAQQFADLMKLGPEENVFFLDLFLLEHAPSHAERQLAFERITAKQRLKGARRIEGDAYEYVSNWYFTAIRELAQSEHFRFDPVWISQHLCPSISVTQASDALQVLSELGVLTQDEDGDAIINDISLATPMQVHGLAVHSYHKQMLGLAGEGIERFPEQLRHFLGVTVNIPASLLPKLKTELNQMAARLLNICDTADGKDTVVMQIGLQLFPLSQGSESK